MRLLGGAKVFTTVRTVVPGPDLLGGLCVIHLLAVLTLKRYHTHTHSHTHSYVHVPIPLRMRTCGTVVRESNAPHALGRSQPHQGMAEQLMQIFLSTSDTFHSRLFIVGCVCVYSLLPSLTFSPSLMHKREDSDIVCARVDVYPRESTCASACPCNYTPSRTSKSSSLAFWTLAHFSSSM